MASPHVVHPPREAAPRASNRAMPAGIAVSGLRDVRGIEPVITRALTLRASLALLLLAGAIYVAGMSAYITVRIAPAGAALEQGVPETAAWHDRLNGDLVWLEATTRETERLLRQHMDKPAGPDPAVTFTRQKLQTWLDRSGPGRTQVPDGGIAAGEISQRLVEAAVAEGEAGRALLDVMAQVARGSASEATWTRLDDAQRLNAVTTGSLADAGRRLREEQLRRQHAFREAGAAVLRAVFWWLLLGIALVPLLAFFVFRRLYRPLSRLDDGLARVSGGDLDTTIAITRDDELGRLGRQFNTMTSVLKQRAEQERQQARRQTERLQEQLIERERLAALGRMAGAIAHEVGAPLNSVLGHAQLLAREDLSERGRRRLGIIESQVQRMVEVIQHYLSRTRDAPTPRARVDVNDLVRDTLGQVELMLTRARVRPHTTLAAPVPYVMGDADGLHRVLVNLIQNAIDAMPGGGHLTIATSFAPAHDAASGTTPPLAHAAPGAGLVVAIDVIDTGAGIPPEVQAKMFDLFYTTKAEGRGTGMGLSICQEIVKMHGGRIVVSSEVGPAARGATAGSFTSSPHGTRMRVLLPADQAGERPGTEPPPTPPPDGERRAPQTPDARRENVRAS